MCVLSSLVLFRGAARTRRARKWIDWTGGCDGWSLVLVEIVPVFSCVGLEAGEMQPTDFFTGDRVFVFFVPNVMKVKLIDNCPKTS